ncbi:MAG: MoxR family ATPase [Firmicutes bacterium]|jgi:MoxR-like ATPase|nr:MoxR family ATPase [Bacillota bacterium]MDH7495364.1 MoxR family ATPase [Bacillota bacterium]
MTEPPVVDKARQKCHEILSEVGKAIVGKDEVLESVLIVLLANGHVLIEDVPGVAKTLTAEMFARVLGLSFNRIQFVPDLLPGDITGSMVYNSRLEDFEFRKGPMFTNLLLADEINRGTPKTQSALLEAMQERQVTVDGRNFKLEPPFLVMATQNPLEFEGTYPLPEAEVDRFMARLRIGYPSSKAEREILSRRQSRKRDEVELLRIVAREEFLSLQGTVETVYVSPDIQDYIVRIVQATRDDHRVHAGSSPRGTLALFKLARARALMRGRDYVIPEDVKSLAMAALAHRIVIRPELWVERVRGEDIVDDVLDRVPTPGPGED